MASTEFYSATLTFLCLVGLGLSIYAYHVESVSEKNPKYRAYCDISEHMSCTKAFNSEYGKGFGLLPKESILSQPNSVLGILFYSLIGTLVQSNSLLMTKLVYWSIFLSNLVSIYFAYILYFKLYDFCIVCVTTYVVNALSLVVSNLKLRALTQEAKIDATKKKN